MLVAGPGLRSAYMLTDPYGSQARLGLRAGLVLYNLPFPLLLTALAALTLLGLGAGAAHSSCRPHSSWEHWRWCTAQGCSPQTCCR